MFLAVQYWLLIETLVRATHIPKPLWARIMWDATESGIIVPDQLNWYDDPWFMQRLRLTYVLGEELGWTQPVRFFTWFDMSHHRRCRLSDDQIDLILDGFPRESIQFVEDAPTEELTEDEKLRRVLLEFGGDSDQYFEALRIMYGLQKRHD